MMGSQIAEYGGEMLYVNNSVPKPMWATGYMHDEAPRSWVDAVTSPWPDARR